MKFKGLYILTITLLLSFSSNAQTVPWTVTPTTQSQDIVIPDTIEFQINGFNIEPGDYIGVLYDSLAGQMAIGGMVEWQGNTTNLLTYGDDGGNPGFNPGDVFQFIIWDQSEDCFIESLSHEFVGGMEEPFTNGNTIVLDKIIGDVNHIFYPHDYFCITQGNDINVIVSGLFNFDTFIFSSTPVGPAPPLGLTINPTTGLIDGSSLNVGTYEINFGVVNSCLQQDSFVIEIGGTLNDTLPTTITPVIQCGDTDVNVVIDSAYFSRGAFPYTFGVFDSISGFTLNQSSPDLGPLTEANYQLQIKDFNNCLMDINILVQAATNCDDERGPVLTPGLNSEFNTHDIDCTGEITIYNRFGRLVNSFTGSTSWDGLDREGKEVPTGLYIIMCDGVKQTELTVIR